ncbi:carboxypeptidase regulatory-like domain-containing protein [Aliikangiella sp. IMCC44632]
MSKTKQTKRFLCSAILGLTGVLSITLGHAATNKESVKWPQAVQQQTLQAHSVITAKPKLSKSFKQMAQPLPKLTQARINKLQQSGEKVPGIDLVREVPNRNHPMAKKLISQQQQNTKKQNIQTKINPLYQKNVPIVGTGFDGIGNVQGAVPPDTNADVGPNHIVQMVNTAIAIWDKQGNILLEPVAINSLWEGFGGLCESTNKGDPIVLYDGAADRWLVSQFAFNGSFTDNHQCIAISQTGDPTGAYYLYDFLYSETKFNDYPHFGVWHNGYFAGVNQFTGDAYSGAGAVVYERDKMLTGQPARQVIIDLEGSSPDAFTPMPADIDGVQMPPQSMPQYFVSAGGAANTIDVWNFNIDWTNPENATFELKQTLNVAAYSGAVCGFDRNCIAQPNSQKLDAIGQRLMFRLAYRNLNGTQHKLIANHTVVGSDTNINIAGVRWYEIDLDESTGAPSIANQGTFNLDDGNSRWMGSAAMDAIGNIGVAYSVSGPDLAPSIRFSGRSANDPADQLTAPETELKAGEGSQAGANRWGDYSSLSIDPSDDCTMWFTTEYYKASGNNSTSWSTYIGNFKFDDCVAGASGQISGVVSDNQSGSPIAGVEVSSGSFKTFSAEDGSYTLTLPEANDYQIRYFKYGWDEQQIADIDITEDAQLTQDISLQPSTPILVTGTVSDGSGLGNGIYAELTINVPGSTLTTITNPSSGAYSIELFGGTLVKMTTKAIDAGYIDQSADFDPANRTTQNFALLVDASCVALGYTVDGFIESFEDGVPPNNWSVDDAVNSGSIWSSTADVRTNLIGTSGEAAIIDSDAAGQGVATDSSLYTPVLNVSELPSLTLEFDTLYRQLGDIFDLEIKVGEDRWNKVISIPGTNQPEQISVDLTSFVNGAPSFQLRWHFYNAVWTWYALVDNVRFAGSQCVPANGSFVQGIVIDENTQTGLSGVKVAAESSSTTSTTTPNDDALSDGYFKLFVLADDPQEITLTKNNYASVTVATSAVDLNNSIALSAGQLAIAPIQPTFEIAETAIRTSSISLTNNGNLDAVANLNLTAAPVNGIVNVRASGPYHPSSRIFGPKALNELTTKKARYKTDYHQFGLAQTEAPIVAHFDFPHKFAWGLGINQATGNLWIGDVKAGDATTEDKLHQFTQAGVSTRQTIDVSSYSIDWAADLAFNNRTGMLWQVQVGGNFCIHEVDPSNLSVTGETICPAFGNGQRGLAYDPLTNTYYSGSWVDMLIHQFKPDGEIIRSVNVGLNVSGLAFNPSSGSLFVMSNAQSPTADITILDTSTPELDPIGSLNYATDTDFDSDGSLDDPLPDEEQAGLAIDCEGNLWTPSRAFKKAVAIASGESGVCDWGDLPWAEITSATDITVPANSSVDIEVIYRATDLTAGNYTAQLVVANDTPYGDQNSQLNLQVVPPSRGVINFASASTNVNEETSLSLSITRSDGSDLPLTINYATANGTAQAGSEYTATSGSIAWADGDSEPKTISIPVSTVHQNETFSVTLSSELEGVLGANSTILVTIIDKPKGSGSLPLYLLVVLVLIARLTSNRIKITKNN